MMTLYERTVNGSLVKAKAKAQSSNSLIFRELCKSDRNASSSFRVRLDSTLTSDSSILLSLEVERIYRLSLRDSA